MEMLAITRSLGTATSALDSVRSHGETGDLDAAGRALAQARYAIGEALARLTHQDGTDDAINVRNLRVRAQQARAELRDAIADGANGDATAALDKAAHVHDRLCEVVDTLTEWEARLNPVLDPLTLVETVRNNIQGSDAPDLTRELDTLARWISDHLS